MKEMMSKQFWKPLLTTPALLSTAVVISTIAGTTSAVKATETIASETQTLTASARSESPALTADASAVTAQPVASTAPVNQLSVYSAEGKVEPDGVSQVTSVSQLSDVQPTDWAFQALQSLVERYGCIVGYPDRTYRGNRALTRYEFAAGLNACMDRINELIAAGTADLAKKEDLLAIQKLQEEFAAELATLRGRVDAVEARTATLEKQQFSTTTRLVGEAIFTIADAFGDFPQQGGTNTVFNDRIRLNLLTSFTGKDRLRVRLQAGNATRLLSNPSIPNAQNNYQRTNEGNLPYDGGNPAADGTVTDPNNSGNAVALEALDYRFPIGNNIFANVFANGALHHYYADTVNPFFEGNGGGQNALSRFAERNPIYRIGPLGAGVGFNVKFSNSLKLDLGYISNTASNPGPDAGLFNGNYSALAQLVFNTGGFKLGLTYVRGYERNTPGLTAGNNFNLGGTGTTFANLNNNSLLRGRSFPVESNSFGVEASFQPTSSIVVNGWLGYSDANIIGLGDADIWNFAVAVGFPNLGKKGNFLGIVAGAEPTLRGTDFDPVNLSPAFASRSQDFAYHIEVFYKYQLTDNISITPGVIYLPSVNQNAGIPGDNSNADVFIGVLRTTFTF
ncbi:iron uptake porin [Leptolyngbya sp. FACHB-321]|uniref:iron uptake porin n=1 Tax=Leptolyngbya sp. FACHB-321 TaxID=2692807 RepID=UPI001F553D32|nr:iron uptake porin [Leptolyngbya sp. FACHB-321]